MRSLLLVLILVSSPAHSSKTTCAAMIKIALLRIRNRVLYPSPDPVINGISQMKLRGIETPRLILKALDSKDKEAAFKILSDVEDTLFVMGPNLEDSKQRVISEMALRGGYKDTRGHGTSFAIYDKETKNLIGYISILYDRYDNRFGLPYAVATEAQNKGYATEAMAALLNAYKGFSNKDIPLIVFPRSDNAASIRVFEKLGFKYVTELKEFRDPKHTLPRQSVYQFVEE